MPTGQGDGGRGLSMRHRVLLLMTYPRCAREVRERIPGARRKRIETVLHRLRADRLIECVTPELRQSRLYQRTFLGGMLAQELADTPLPETDYEFSKDELIDYEWVQAGTYRRHVLRAMNEPMRAKDIRKSVLPGHSRIGMNHVHTVLWGFNARGIARCDRSRHWRLTEAGIWFRAVELEGLPERPRVVGTR